MNQTEIIAEAQNLFGNVIPNRVELVALSNHIKKPALRAYGLAKVAKGKNTLDGYVTALELTAAIKGDSNKTEFITAVKIVLGAYLLSPNMAINSTMEKFLKKVKFSYLKALPRQELLRNIENNVEAVLRTECTILEFAMDKTFRQMHVNLMDMIFAEESLSNSYGLPNKHFFDEDITPLHIIERVYIELMKDAPEPDYLSIIRDVANAALFSQGSTILPREGSYINYEPDMLDENPDLKKSFAELGLDIKTIKVFSDIMSEKLEVPKERLSLDMKVGEYIEHLKQSL